MFKVLHESAKKEGSAGKRFESNVLWSTKWMPQVLALFLTFWHPPHTHLAVGRPAPDGRRVPRLGWVVVGGACWAAQDVMQPNSPIQIGTFTTLTTTVP